MDGHIRTCWFIFYRYNHGIYSDEIKSIISPKASFSWNTRFTKIQHPYAHKLDTNRTNAFANSFTLWLLETGTLFPCPSSQLHITFSLSQISSIPTQSLKPLLYFHDPRLPLSGVLIFCRSRPSRPIPRVLDSGVESLSRPRCRILSQSLSPSY